MLTNRYKQIYGIKLLIYATTFLWLVNIIFTSDNVCFMVKEMSLFQIWQHNDLGYPGCNVGCQWCGAIQVSQTVYPGWLLFIGICYMSPYQVFLLDCQKYCLK